MAPFKSLVCTAGFAAVMAIDPAAMKSCGPLLNFSARLSGRNIRNIFSRIYRDYLDSLRPVSSRSWPMVAPLALYTYVLAEGSDKEALADIRQKALAAAAAIVLRCLSGGPNPGRQDAVMKKLLSPDTPRGRMYVDETGAYACNEVAINWNARCYSCWPA